MEYESGGEWKPAAHLNLLCEKLEAVERGEIKRLIVEMPPRHGKSEVVSKKFPAWYLGRNPDKEVILTSYGADLTFDFSRIARDTFERWGTELWDVKLSARSSAVGRWEIKGRRGGLTAAGIGGPITGRGAHVAIIDDPVKNWEEANSKTYREAVWNWYRTVLRTRLAPGGAIVIILTRWHEDDLAGRLLYEAQNGGEQWEVICLPAIAEADDLLGREVGEPLWPEHGFDVGWAAETKTAVGNYVWNALYQQRPLPAGGGIFKHEWFRIIEPDRVPGDLAWVRYWDLATSTKTTADYTRGAKVALDADGNLLIGDMRGGRWEWPDARRIIIQTALVDGPEVAVGIEKVGFQGAAWQELMREPQLVAHTIVPVEVDRDKVSRAMPWAARAEAGKVILIAGEWIGPFLDEVTVFPLGAHDDQVDAVSGAVQMLAQAVEPWDTYTPDTAWR